MQQSRFSAVQKPILHRFSQELDFVNKKLASSDINSIVYHFYIIQVE